jgi:hypothetical protein
MMSGVVAIFFVYDWCAWYGEMCRGAGVGNGHVNSDFDFCGVHEGVGAKFHLLGHCRPCFCSGWEWCIVLFYFEYGTVLGAVACYYSHVIVV